MLIRVWISISLLLGISYCDSFVEKKIHLSHECNSVKICYQYPAGCEMDECEGGFTVARAKYQDPNFGAIYEIYVPILVEKSNYIAIESTNLKTGEKYVRLCLPNEKKAMFAYKGDALSIDENHVMEVVTTMFSEEPYPATTICVFKDASPMKHSDGEVFVSDVTTGVLSNDTYYPPKMTIQIAGATKLDFDVLDNVNFPDPVLDDGEEEVNEAGLNSEKEEAKKSTTTTHPDQSFGKTEGAFVGESVELTSVSGTIEETTPGVDKTTVEEINKELTSEESVKDISVGETIDKSTVKGSAENKLSNESVKKDLIEDSTEETPIGEDIRTSTVDESIEETSIEEISKGLSSKSPVEESSDEETSEESNLQKSAEKKPSKESVKKHLKDESAQETPNREASDQSTLKGSAKKNSSKESVKKHLVEESVEEYSIGDHEEDSKEIHNESHMTPSSSNRPVSSSSTTPTTRKTHKKDHLNRDFHSTGGQTRLATPKSKGSKSELSEEITHEVDDDVKDSVRGELRSLDITEDEPFKKPTAPKRTQSYRQRDQYERREHDDEEHKRKDGDYRKSMRKEFPNEEEKNSEDGTKKEEDDVEEMENIESDRKKERDGDKSKSIEMHPKNLHRHQDAQIGSEEDEDSACSRSLVLPVVLALWALV